MRDDGKVVLNEDVIVLCDPCHAKYHDKGDKTVEEVCDQMA